MLIGDECGRMTAFGWDIEKTRADQGNVRLTKVDLGMVGDVSSRCPYFHILTPDLTTVVPHVYRLRLRFRGFGLW